MLDTSKSLLFRAQQGDEAARNGLAILYRPLLVGWLRQQQLADADIDDLAQEILVTVLARLRDFAHSGRAGAFRLWLKTIAINRCRDFRRSRKPVAIGMGGPDSSDFLDRLEDPNSALTRQWDEEYSRYLFRCMLDLVRREFEPRTVEAFLLTAVEDRPAAEVATILGMSAGAVYIARSRVLSRLRELGEGLVD